MLVSPGGSADHSVTLQQSGSADLDFLSGLRVISDGSIKCNNNEMNILHLVETASGHVLMRGDEGGVRGWGGQQQLHAGHS